jgi:hypothetical protein
MKVGKEIEIEIEIGIFERSATARFVEDGWTVCQMQQAALQRFV